MTNRPKRIQENLLAGPERRLLTWLCARMPRWMTPDILTATGLAGAALTGIGYAASNSNPFWLILAIAGFVVQWFGDSLDGSLARFRRIERPSYGYFVDHSCDGLTILFIMVGMGASPYVTMSIALFALAGYLLLAIHTFLIAHVIHEFPLSHFNIGPTELRIILIILSLSMLLTKNMASPPSARIYFDVFVVFCAGIMVFLFVTRTWSVSRKLAASDMVYGSAANFDRP